MSNVPPPPPGGFPPPPDQGGFAPPPPPAGGGFAQPAYGQPAYGQVGSAPYGGFWARFAALLIDGVITSLFNLPGYIALQVGPTKIDDCPDSISTNDFAICEVPTGGTWAIAIVLFIAGFIATVMYFGIMDGKGATVGKKALGLRVADADTGQPIGTGRGVGRYFARILSALACYLGYLWMLWDDKSQCWHDKLVNDVVLSDR